MRNETATRELKQVFRNVVIRASAGTGKTYALSNRYLQLLASGQECQTILATTFTKKGAGEILDRIVGRLAEAALDAQATEELSERLDWNLTQERTGKILHQLLRNLHRLEIGTLDSFFSRIARVFSLELGLPPTWEIVEDQQMRRLYSRAIGQVLQSRPAMELLNLMAKGDVPRRVATLLHDTVDNIYRTFRDSGPKPWDRIARTSQFLSDEALAQLTGAMENLLMNKKSLAEHWTKVIEAVQQRDWEAFIHQRSFQNFLDGNHRYGQTKLPEEVLSIYGQLLPHCRAHVEDSLIKQNHSTRDLLGIFGDHLNRMQNQTGSLRFDDVTNRLQSLIASWDSERSNFRLDQRIQHVMLDEFQDTSLGQWQIVRPFVSRVAESPDELRSFFCVGDLKQAIYGWRGGIAEIFDLVDREFDQLQSQTLTKSYRSSPAVIHFVNQVFLNTANYEIDDPLVKQAIASWSQWFSEHTTEYEDMPGYVAIEKADSNPESTEMEGSAEAIANQMLDLKAIERIAQLDASLPESNTMGVLVRTNQQVSRLIAELQQRGIDASEEGGSILTDSAAVELILSALTLADHPGDSIARFHVSHSPLAGGLGLLPEDDANQRENMEFGHTASAQLRRRLVYEGYGPVVESLAAVLVPSCTKRELSRLQQLVQLAWARSHQSDLWGLRPKRFVDYVRDEARMAEPSGSRIRVMTIHQAKGLEFDVVVFPIPQRAGNWNGQSPSVVVGRDSPASPIDLVTRYQGKELRKLLPESVQQVFEEDLKREVREAMCVLYVALTRAAHALHVILPSNAKSTSKSITGLILASVGGDEAANEGVIYEYGNANWFNGTAAV